MDQNEIVKSSVDGFKVRCDHRMISLSQKDIDTLTDTLNEILNQYVDNAQLQGEYSGEK
jgi:hypothetical protein